MSFKEAFRSVRALLRPALLPASRVVPVAAAKL